MYFYNRWVTNSSQSIGWCLVMPGACAPPIHLCPSTSQISPAHFSQPYFPFFHKPLFLKPKPYFLKVPNIKIHNLKTKRLEKSPFFLISAKIRKYSDCLLHACRDSAIFGSFQMTLSSLFKEKKLSLFTGGTG